MKQEQKHILKKNVLAIGLSFVIPVAIMATCYFQLGIYPTSDRTILASDGFGQLVNFYSGFNNFLHGQQSFFYTWSSSLGLNFVSLMSYYTNSLFTFIVFFFDNLYIPDAMYLILLLKIGTMGITFWIFSEQTFHLPQLLKVSLSIFYALMSFTVAYSIMLMWLDAMIYLPLILLGIHRVMDKSKPILLFVSYFLLFITNYYMAFMVGVFSCIYFFVRTLTIWERYKKAIPHYFVTSLLAGGASMVIILPSVMDLRMNGEKMDTIKRFFTEDVGPWDFIVKSMSGVYDTSKFESAPFIYIGLLSLLFAIFYFVTNKVPLKNKLLYGSLLLVIVASVYIQPLNLFWQGLHSPNMFLFRYSFLYSTLVLILAGYGLEKFEKKDLNILGNITLSLVGLFILIVIVANKKRYGYITQESLIVSAVLLLIYLLIIGLKVNYPKYTALLSVLLFLCICGELYFNTQQMTIGIDREWGYVNRKYYTKAYQQISPLVNKTKEHTKGFYRMENLDPISRTDSFNYNYSGITMFSSIRNRHSSQYMDRLGYRSPDTNLNIHYQNNTLLMDELLGVKYNLAKNDPRKYGFKKIASEKNYSLYENKYALPLGILTDEGIYQPKNNSNQTALIQYLSRREDTLFQFTSLKEVGRNNLVVSEQGDYTYFSEETSDGESRKITWEVSIPEKSQAYLTLDTRASKGLDDGTVEISVSGQKTISPLSSTGIYHNLGYYEKAKTIKVTAEFTGNTIIKIVRPSVLLLKTEALDQAIASIRQKEVVFDVKGNKVEAEVNAKKEQLVFTTIPYDAGWKATIDGKIVTIKAIQDALISVKVPEGKHKIKLIYYPEGMKVGCFLFASCFLAFTGYIYWLKKKVKEGKVK
ncbi:YfhO family protein [Enterococcus caccae]|uniref:ABC transporter permease n=1 Tax=Enterococcus caccae ATCC BAA-1240 TaxID=1158612 RepID=R3WRM6_9ENTE|nr:YfhO family protein [Enterococcus caccae]EOL50476.1 hypothetical protein UC7_00469 [Enterococcus caccae ATCC BAA-1240]EOT59087.1 hypothetical protein I580_02119 [Enterococcus caccae ATCC BAA-1240]OJG25619.1 hypothetical protein RU98_GL000860 [Enterococcus caccae]